MPLARYVAFGSFAMVMATAAGMAFLCAWLSFRHVMRTGRASGSWTGPLGFILGALATEAIFLQYSLSVHGSDPKLGISIISSAISAGFIELLAGLTAGGVLFYAVRRHMGTPEAEPVPRGGDVDVSADRKSRRWLSATIGASALASVVAWYALQGHEGFWLAPVALPYFALIQLAKLGGLLPAIVTGISLGLVFLVLWAYRRPESRALRAAAIVSIAVYTVLNMAFMTPTY